MTTDPYIKQPQFMVFASTGVTAGKKAQTKNTARKQRPARLMASPYRPSDHGRGGSGSLPRRFITRQAIEIAYDDKPLPTLRVNKAVRAAVDPILIRESRTLTAIEIRTALTGIFHPGETCNC